MTDENALTASQMERLRAALEQVPFAKLLKIELVTARLGSAVLRFPITENLRQINGVVHGGAIASLIDSATAFAIVPLVAIDEKFTTIDLSISYLRPLTQGVALAEARVLRCGRRIISVAAEVKDDAGKLAATALSSYLRLG